MGLARIELHISRTEERIIELSAEEGLLTPIETLAVIGEKILLEHLVERRQGNSHKLARKTRSLALQNVEESMSNGADDFRSLDAIRQRIAEVEVSIEAFRRLLDSGVYPSMDWVHLRRAERLLEGLYVQRQSILDRWQAEPD